MLKKSVLLLFVVFILGEAAFIDTLGKCSFEDSPCLSKLFTTSMSSVAKTGIPEYGIPPFDPYEVKNISASILNMVELGMVDGVAKNIKSCVFDRIELNFENPHTLMDVTCDITVKGRYKIVTTNPIVKNVLGSTVQGDGFGKAKLDKVRMIFECDLILRETDGEIYIDWRNEDLRYNYTVEKASFAGNNVQIGGIEISNQIIGMMNENWEFLMTTFGRTFFDVGISISNTYMHKFFDTAPARYYLTEDLKQFKKV